MLHQQNLLKMLARAVTVRTPADMRSLFGSQISRRTPEEPEMQANGQELAGSGALVFEGEIVEITRIH